MHTAIGVLYGLVPAGRAEDHQPQDHHRGHEAAAARLQVQTVHIPRPRSNNMNIRLYRSNFEAAQPPILIDNGVAILENEKIERHIMKHVPGGHNLFVPGESEC